MHTDLANYPNSELSFAVITGDAARIHALYAARKIPPHYGAQALRHAAYFGQMESFVALMEEGESPNYQYHQHSPLSAAIDGFQCEPNYGLKCHETPGDNEWTRRNEVLMRLTKCMLAAGLELPLDSRFMDRLDKMDRVPFLPIFINNIINGDEPIPTEATLATEGIRFNEERCHSAIQQHNLEMARLEREESGIFLNHDALRAHDIRPNNTLTKPLQINGRIIRPQAPDNGPKL